MSSPSKTTMVYRTKEDNKRKRKNCSDNDIELPKDVEGLRLCLKEMNEEEEDIERNTPPDTPIEEVQNRRRNWHRRKIAYLDMIAKAFSRNQKDAIPKPRQNDSPLGLAGRAQVELVLQLYTKQERSSSEQSALRANTIKYYGVERIRDGANECWCVATSTWGPSKQRTAGHIMPTRLRQLPFKHIFGEEAAKELYSPRNALMMEFQFEKHFDRCQIAIIPCLHEKDAWEIRIMDKHLLNQDHNFMATTFAPLHGQKLVFLNQNRPRKRYLYYHWMVCIHTAAQMKRNVARIQEERARFDEYWGTPGRYLREEMIAAMMKMTGHELPTETSRVGEDGDANEDEANENEDGDEDEDEDEDGNENENENENGE